jgi:iduronate 2-sulfatase
MAVAALVAVNCVNLAWSQPPFNVLFIAADDLRCDLGCYGHPLVKSPNIDRLAHRGLVFERAYCQQAVCNPSRASVLTGRRIDSLRVWDLRTHFRDTTPNAVTLPEHFKNHGYFTQNVGKIFHNWLHQIQGDPQSWSVPAQMHFASHGTDKPLLDQPWPASSAVDSKCECRDVPDEAYFDGRVAALAIDALRSCAANSSQPFFLAVGFWKPHAPMNAPKKYWDLYQRSEILLPANNVWPTDTPKIAWHNSREILGEGQNARELSDDAIREIRHGYLANISYLDAQIGKVLDELDRLQMTDRTIIIFWSDHGFHLGEHTLWAKTSNFELDTRVPLILSLPQSLRTALEQLRDPSKPVSSPVQSTSRTSSIVELLDLYPTLVELCGLQPQKECEGVSLVPTLCDSTATVREAARSQHPRPAYYQDHPTAMGYSIRTNTHRYTEWRDWETGNTLAKELYDHRQDTEETRNLAHQSDARSELMKHENLLHRTKPLVAPQWKRPN